MNYLMRFLVFTFSLSILWPAYLSVSDGDIYYIKGGRYDGYYLADKGSCCSNKYIYANFPDNIGVYEVNQKETANFNTVEIKVLSNGIYECIGNYAGELKGSIFIDARAFSMDGAEPDDFPPMLEIQNLKFTTGAEMPDRLAAGSTGYIEFDIVNEGRGYASGIIFSIDIKEKSSDLNFDKALFINKLPSKGKKHIKIPLKAKISSESTTHKFTISASEANGFDADDKKINIEVLEISTPSFKVASIIIDDDQEGNSYGNSNKVIEKGETIELNIKIKNDGSGMAEDFKAELILDEKLKGFFLPKSNKKKFSQDVVAPGEVINMSLYFYTNKKVKKGSIPLTLKVTEKTGEFSLTQKLDLKIEDIKTY